MFSPAQVWAWDNYPFSVLMVVGGGEDDNKRWGKQEQSGQVGRMSCPQYLSFWSL